MNLNRTLPLAAALVCAAVITISCTRQSDIDRKVEKLLSQMTLDEKIGQMHQVSSGELEWMEEQVRTGAVGSILNEVDPAVIDRLQHIAVEESRLGIPLLASRDVIHGFRTIFPIPLGLAATFDPEIVERGARIAAVEASASGIRWTFSPMLDIARDPRWGRMAEGSGEDPYLDALMGAAMVRGYQTDDLSNPSSMAACIKHFAGYGVAEGGRDYNSTPIPERLLANVYLPPFKACVDAGAATLMTAFNEIDGIPCTGNRHLVTDILRNEWGFDGMVVTDWNSAGEMIAHGYSADLKDAAVSALDAGVDMDMMSYSFHNHLKELVDEGLVSMKSIDNAVRNILRLKFRLGLFDNPYIDVAAAREKVYAPEHLEAARATAAESAILLQNRNGVLPLEGVRRILVTGPLADAPYDQLGTWVFDGEEEHTVTPLTSLRSRFDVVYVPTLEYSRDNSTSRFAQARSAAAGCDAAVVFLGEEAILSGEAHSLSNLDLQGAQSELLAEIKRSGKPVVAVVFAGRPLTIERDLENCDAMLYMFHPGTMGGEAVADLLTGKEVPSGKTPVTFLREVGQAPFYYNHNNSGRPCDGTETLLDDIPLKAGQTSLGNTSFYLDSGYGPLFPFGYGLSYTAFSYDNIKLSKRVYGVNETIEAEFDLTNTGSRKGTEVVQLYIRDLVGSAVRPVKELKRFERVELAAGETKHISMTLPVSELAFFGADMRCKVEPGDFLLWIAGDSASGRPVEFEVR